MSNEETEELADLELRAEIDRSLRWPLLFFFTSGASWLLLSTVLGFLASIALMFPHLFENISMLQYGRLLPAFQNAIIYGWAIQVGIGVGYWLLGRLGRVPLKNSLGVLVGGHLWNGGVTFGILTILFGFGNSQQWLDFPAALFPFLLVSYVVMMLGMVGMYASRRHREGFITQGFVLTSLFWFPLIYLTACVFIHLGSGPAVLKTVINSWFGGNLIYLVLGSMALGASHYFVSKTTGRPLHSQQLAQIGFWSFLIFGSWTGVSRYMGGPIPAWMPTLSSVAATLLVIPAVMILVNLLKTAGDRLGWASYSPSLRFTLFGMGAFVVTVVMGAFLSRFSTGAELQFSHAWPAYELLAIYGFFSMTMFGAVYFIVPRLVGCEWPSGSLVRFHFWFSAYGTIGMVAFLFFAGMAQGHLQNIWSENFLVSVERSRPYFASLAIGWTLITLSNLAFFFQLSLMFIRRGRRVGEGPTLIHKRPEDYFNDPLVGSDEAAKA